MVNLVRVCLHTCSFSRLFADSLLVFVHWCWPSHVALHFSRLLSVILGKIRSWMYVTASPAFWRTYCSVSVILRVLVCLDTLQHQRHRTNVKSHFRVHLSVFLQTTNADGHCPYSVSSKISGLHAEMQTSEHWPLQAPRLNLQPDRHKLTHWKLMQCNSKLH